MKKFYFVEDRCSDRFDLGLYDLDPAGGVEGLYDLEEIA